MSMKNRVVNNICICLDESGSMLSLRNEAARYYNKIIDDIKRNSEKHNHYTRVTLIKFANNARLQFSHAGLDTNHLQNLWDYNPSGSTAMLDAVGRAIEELSSVDNDYDDVSNTVIVITDGQENNSSRYNKESIRKLLLQKQKTDRWTFAFQVPRGYKHYPISFGVVEDNVFEWDQTSHGTQVASHATSAGLDSYFTARSAGKSP